MKQENNASQLVAFSGRLVYNLTKAPPERGLNLQNKVSLCERDTSGDYD